MFGLWMLELICDRDTYSVNLGRSAKRINDMTSWTEEIPKALWRGTPHDASEIRGSWQMCLRTKIGQ